ncbi:PepSY-associated TM helix domain-containing protein [Duganella radicis]|uniref:PepSY domain-containing protein n=1 Tax=Duganella radicis TaxID=551988 RepID=A0A6L6PSM3_9BURK|nr:PepSY-associated TM helix domain-containing protein [Duganella radicis]MTV41667.1 PepSY domain-containing protein [Duganella radicis]
MRAFWTLVHRYLGLLTAGFLFISGITGAVISWDHELDDLLNPHLMEAHTPGTPQPTLALVRQLEARYPQVQVSFVPLQLEPGEAIAFGVTARVDPVTQKRYEPGFNQVFVDPVSGTELGKREWGAVWPITKETFVSFLYRLHYTLHIPEMWGIDRWGIWLMGGIAIIWVIDSFVGFYLTLPLHRQNANKTWMQRWKPAWKVRWNGGGTKLNFDLHRAFSLWTWILLFILAFTAFSLNLYSEVFYPVMSKISKVTPTPFDTRPIADIHKPYVPTVGYAQVIAAASAEATQRKWEEPVGSVFYTSAFDVYGVSFYKPGDDHGSGGVGPAYLYYDGAGKLLGERLPWKGTAADIFVQAQFPLHSGRILGLPGRILISFMGVVVAMLSVTGVIIWWRKRASRVVTAERRAGELAGA